MNNTLFKLTIVFTLITIPAVGYFTWQSFADTKIVKTLTTNPSLKRGLIGYWTFDGLDLVNNAVDRSGNKYTGYLTNFTSTTTIPGKIEQALKFDGSNDYVTNTESGLNISNNPLTVSMWVKRHSDLVYNETDALIIKRGSSSYYYYFRMDGVTDTLEFTAGGGGTEKSVAYPYTRDYTNFHHLVATFNPVTDKTIVYIDGDATIFTDTTSSFASGNGILEIGNGFDGFIDDVRVYDRDLSAEEVTLLYNLGATTYVNKTLATNPDLERGLVGHWTFDGKELINNATDRSGNGNDGYLTNFTSTTTMPGKIGQALELSGISEEFIDLGATKFIDTGKPFTVSAWVYLNSYINSFPGILRLQNDGTNNWELFFSNSASYQPITFGAASGSGWGQFRSNNTGLAGTTDKWEHIIVTYNGSSGIVQGNFKLYVNGVSQDLTTSGGISADIATSAIGTEGGLEWDGLMDDVRIYDRALSEGEIKRLYNLGATTYVNKTLATNPDLERGLVGHWTFDGGDMNPNVRDRSGNDNNGYLTGFTSTTTRPGKIGQALDFDGSDDWVDTPITNSYKTISFWMKQTGTGSWYPPASDDEAGSGCGDWLLYYKDNNTLLYEYDGTARAVKTMTLNQWDLLTMTADGTNWIVYINGVEELKHVKSCDLGAVAGSNGLRIGRYSASSDYFNGTLDDVRIYNRALSADEIKRLYELGR